MLQNIHLWHYLSFDLGCESVKLQDVPLCMSRSKGKVGIKI